MTSPSLLDPHTLKEKLPVLVLGLAVLPYFVVRGWMSAAIVMLGVGALFALHQRAYWRKILDQQALLVVMGALCAPLLAAALVQAAHGQFVARSFDPLVRLVLAALLLAYLYIHRVSWLPVARVALPIAILVGVAWIYSPWVLKYHAQWGNRVASQFMDPLMLAQHASLAAFLCLFLIRKEAPRALTALQVAAVVAGIGVSLATGSRTGWGMIPVIALLWLASMGWLKRPVHLAAGLALVALLSVGLYAGSTTVHHRLVEAEQEIRSFFDGTTRNTSIGVRLTMYGIAWEAFWAKPLLGWGFTQVPTPQTLPVIAPYWNDLIRSTLTDTGAHNEWLQSSIRMGIVGWLSRLAMFGVPLLVFLRAARSQSPERKTAGYLGLVVLIAYLSAGMTTEVMHLVFTASYFGFMVATLGAIALPPPHRPE